MAQLKLRSLLLTSLGILSLSCAFSVSIAQETGCTNYMQDEAGNQTCLDNYFTPPAATESPIPQSTQQRSNVTVRDVTPETPSPYRGIVTVKGKPTGQFMTENNEIINKKGKLESVINEDGVITTPKGEVRGIIQSQDSHQIILDLKGNILGIVDDNPVPATYVEP